MTRIHKIFLGITLAALASPGWAHAEVLLLDAGPANGTTSRSADNGPGTAVSVATTTNLTQMAMDIELPSGGDIKYMIWDGTDSNLLFSQTQAVAASNSFSYVLSTPFSFTLDAGDTYYFGVIADNDLEVGYIFPADTVTQNGLTTLATGNSNYLDFASPAVTAGGATTITLQLYGTQGASPTPEPATALLAGIGIGILALGRKALARR